MVSARMRPPTDPTGDPRRDHAMTVTPGGAADEPARDAAAVGSPSQLEPRSAAQLPSGLNVLAGVWLILAPSMFGYRDGGDATWNDAIIGGAVALLALVRVTSPRATAALSWVNFVLGAWLIAAPFVLAYSDGPEAVAATANDVVLGVVVLALAAWSAAIGRRDRQASTPDR